MKTKPIPNDVIGFLNISADQKQICPGSQSEKLELPFREIIFYSDSD
jgi:hypothetical protein